MSNTYRIGSYTPWGHQQATGPRVLALASGESVPAASGYTVGDQIIELGKDREGRCVNIGGTYYWLGPPQNAPLTDDSNNIAATTGYLTGLAPSYSGTNFMIMNMTIAGDVDTNNSAGANYRIRFRAQSAGGGFVTLADTYTSAWGADTAVYSQIAVNTQYSPSAAGTINYSITKNGAPGALRASISVQAREIIA